MPINMNSHSYNYSNDSYLINQSSFPIGKNPQESYDTLNKNINLNKSKHTSYKNVN